MPAATIRVDQLLHFEVAYSGSKAVIIYPAEAMITAAGKELERNIGAADRHLGIESKKRNILGSWLHRTFNANLER